MSETLNKVIEKFQQREQVGLNKYGTTVDRKDYTSHDWLVHLQEELMDATLYVQRLIDEKDKEIQELKGLVVELRETINKEIQELKELVGELREIIKEYENQQFP